MGRTSWELLETELHEMVKFLESQRVQGDISNFCSAQNISVAILPRACTTLWRALGGGCKEHEDTLEEDCLQHEADI